MTDLDHQVDDKTGVELEELSTPTTIGVEAYTSEAYARAERDKLWRKVWQQVGRVEEIPDVGSYLTYDILDDSIIVVRTGAELISAFLPTTTSASTAAVGSSTPRRAPRTRATRPGSCSSVDSTAGHTAWTAHAPTSATRTTGRACSHRRTPTCARQRRHLGRLAVRQHGPRLRTAGRLPRTRPRTSSIPSSWRTCASSGASG